MLQNIVLVSQTDKRAADDVQLRLKRFDLRDKIRPLFPISRTLKAKFDFVKGLPYEG